MLTHPCIFFSFLSHFPCFFFFSCKANLISHLHQKPVQVWLLCSAVHKSPITFFIFNGKYQKQRSNLILCSGCHQQSSIFNIAMCIFLKHCPLLLWWLCPLLSLCCHVLSMSSSLCGCPMYLCLSSFLLSLLNMGNLIHTNSTTIHRSSTSQQSNLFLSKANFEPFLQYFIMTI